MTLLILYERQKVHQSPFQKEIMTIARGMLIKIN